MLKNRFLKHFSFLKFLFLTFFSSLTNSALASKHKINTKGNPVIGTLDNVFVKYSNNAKVFMTLQSKAWIQYENGDSEFPYEIKISIFNKKQELIMTIHANKAISYKEKKLWLLLGDVEVLSFDRKKHLRQVNTELLYWDQERETIYNNNFVRIESDDFCFTGTNFFSRQNFSYYKIDKIEGTAYIDKNSF